MKGVYKDRMQEWTLISVMLAVATGLLWWQISPQTYTQFDSICKNFDYNSCMRWYWENLNFFRVATGIFAVGLVVSVVVWGYFVIQKFVGHEGTDQGRRK